MIKRTSEVCPLTVSLAYQLRDMESAPWDRDFDPGRVEFLRRQADAGVFGTCYWSYALLGTEPRRLNGQHSSAMLVALADEGKFPTGLQVFLRRYEVDTMLELMLLQQWKRYKLRLVLGACALCFIGGWMTRGLVG